MGKLTAHSLRTGTPFPDIALEVYREHSDVFGPDVYAVLDIDTALKARKGIGAPSPANVGRQLARWARLLRQPKPL